MSSYVQKKLKLFLNLSKYLMNFFSCKPYTEPYETIRKHAWNPILTYLCMHWNTLETHCTKATSPAWLADSMQGYLASIAGRFSANGPRVQQSRQYDWQNQDEWMDDGWRWWWWTDGMALVLYAIINGGNFAALRHLQWRNLWLLYCMKEPANPSGGIP